MRDDRIRFPQDVKHAMVGQQVRDGAGAKDSNAGIRG
jgi:hypothetical protein